MNARIAAKLASRAEVISAPPPPPLPPSPPSNSPRPQVFNNPTNRAKALKLLTSGATLQMVADTFGISTRTVTTFKKRFYRPAMQLAPALAAAQIPLSQARAISSGHLAKKEAELVDSANVLAKLLARANRREEIIDRAVDASEPSAISLLISSDIKNSEFQAKLLEIGGYGRDQSNTDINVAVLLPGLETYRSPKQAVNVEFDDSDPEMMRGY